MGFHFVVVFMLAVSLVQVVYNYFQSNVCWLVFILVGWSSFHISLCCSHAGPCFACTSALSFRSLCSLVN